MIAWFSFLHDAKINWNEKEYIFNSYGIHGKRSKNCPFSCQTVTVESTVLAMTIDQWRMLNGKHFWNCWNWQSISIRHKIRWLETSQHNFPCWLSPTKYKQKYKKYFYSRPSASHTNTISGMIFLLYFLFVKATIAANPANDLKIQIPNTQIQNPEIQKTKYKYNFRDESPAVSPPREGDNCCKPSRWSRKMPFVQQCPGWLSERVREGIKKKCPF